MTAGVPGRPRSGQECPSYNDRSGRTAAGARHGSHDLPALSLSERHSCRDMTADVPGRPRSGQECPSYNDRNGLTWVSAASSRGRRTPAPDLRRFWLFTEPRAVAALGVLEVVDRVAHARASWRPSCGRGRGGRGRRGWWSRRTPSGTSRPCATQLVRRPGLDVGPLLGLVGVAVLGHPARAGQQLVVALHVEQRHLADDGAEQLRAHGEGAADQQAALRAAHDAEVLRRGDLARDQVLGDRDEVLEGLDAVLLDAPPCASAGRTRRRRGCWPGRRRRRARATPRRAIAA